MPDPEKIFNALADGFAKQPDVVRGQMFGKLCVKVNGKAFIAFHKDEMVFKLGGEAHKKALAMKNAHLWDPSGKGRPMKEWVCVPAFHSTLWKEFSEYAQTYVAEATSK
jgi:hypothetical protein